jgi:hypothetical protein
LHDPDGQIGDVFEPVGDKLQGFALSQAGVAGNHGEAAV